MSNAAGSAMHKCKSWADVDNDDFFAQVAQDKPKFDSRQASPTAAWPSSRDKSASDTKKSGGVPWSFPNPVQPGQGMSGNAGSRFESLSPNQRRSAPLANWRR